MTSTSKWTMAVSLVLSLTSCRVYAATLEFWHPWPHAENIVRELAAQYSREHGVTVRVKTYDPSSHSPWITGGPDIIGLYRPTKKTVEDLVRQNRIGNISREAGTNWYTRFWPGVRETFILREKGNRRVYGVPLTGQVYMFVYNKDLFKRAGIEGPPETWSELMSASERLQQVGVVPYAGGFGSDRPPLAHAYEWSRIGLHNLMQTYFGRRPYTSADWVRSLEIYTEMKTAGFTTPAWAQMSESSAIKAMLDGQTAMVFVGPGFESIRRAYKSSFTSWDVFGTPTDSRSKFLPRMPGGVVEGLVINNKSSKKAVAVKFAAWLAEQPQQVALANRTLSIPAVAGACEASGLDSYLKTFASGMRNQGVDLTTYERPEVLHALYGGARSLLAGSKNPPAVARYVQSVKKD